MLLQFRLFILFFLAKTLCNNRVEAVGLTAYSTEKVGHLLWNVIETIQYEKFIEAIGLTEKAVTHNEKATDITLCASFAAFFLATFFHASFSLYESDF